MSATAEPDGERLLAALKRTRPEIEALDAMKRLSGGASLESWSFRATTSANQTDPIRLVLRRAPAATLAGPTAPKSLALEAAVIGAAQAQGVLVPEVVVELVPEDDLGAGFVMGHVEGETIPQKILRNPAFNDALDGLAGQCGTALAGIHAIDPAGLPPMEVADAPTTLDNLERQLREFGHASPVFTTALMWLRQRAEPLAEPSLVHGDFRHGNLMIDSAGLAAVLDWELCHLGDPMEDLGWLCAPSWRFGVQAKPVGGFGEREDLFASYEAATGVAVDGEKVRFWEAVAALKWGVICLMMYKSFELGVDRSVERAAIGRRVSETEIDLVDMMFGEEEPRSGVEDGSATETMIVGASPTIGELLESVEGFLRDVAMPGLDGRKGFHARVAANVVATIGREVALGPVAEAEERDGIAVLLGDSAPRDTALGDGVPRDSALADSTLIELRHQLCSAIGDGKVHFEDPALVAHLRATAARAIRIDQPKYRSRQ